MVGRYPASSDPGACGLLRADLGVMGSNVVCSPGGMLSSWTAGSTRGGYAILRLAALLGLVGVLARAGCGSDRPTSPVFELGVDEVACELVYGSRTGP